MPWKETDAMESRMRFVLEYERGDFSLAELCRRHGISRPSGYEALRRYREGGVAGLQERSRAPQRHPNQTSRAVEELILDLRRQHATWGPKKLRAKLVQRQPQRAWPALSTIGDLLHREGLSQGRKYRRQTPRYCEPFVEIADANQVWCMDFKGWFRTGDGERIDAFTLTDAHTRYLLRCQAVDKTDTEQVRGVLEAGFREYGMPQAIRSDNGPPFASRALAGLSRLAVYLMKLDIVPERIAPGHPEQNGRHERMHRTLKAETATPPAANRRAQQRKFERFRREYNEERPHEALGQRTPASCYAGSTRSYPARLPQPEYGNHMLVRRVQEHGEFSWKHEKVFLSETLWGEPVGLEPIDERYYRVYFARFPIAQFDSHKKVMQPLSDEPASGE